MPKRELKPVVPSDYLTENLQTAVMKVLRVLLFDPLLTEFEATRHNARTKPSLISRLDSVEVTYRDDTFQGKLDAATGAALRKLGAKYSKPKRGWVIPYARLPADLQAAVDRQRTGLELVEKQAREAVARLQAQANAIMPKVDFQRIAAHSEGIIDRKVRTTLADAIAVQPELDPKQTSELRRDYSENVSLAIKGFIDDEVLRFRQEVIPNIRSGMGRRDVVDYVQSRLKVGKTRARFIARQETALFTSKVKQVQYEKAGIDRYRWKAIGGKRGDGRTREEHADVHGKIFFWDKDVSEDGTPKPRNKNGPTNPGEDFGCRCQAVPIVDEL